MPRNLPTNTTIGTALGLAYGTIAILVHELLTGIENAETRDATDPAMLAVHELREVAVPELTPWVRDVRARIDSIAREMSTEPHDRITDAIEILGEVRYDLRQWRESLVADYEPVPSEIDELIDTIEDDIQRLDAVELP